MGNLNENYVMTTASGLSGFAILVSPNHPNMNVSAELTRLWSRIAAEATARSAAINALRFFKTIGGVAATMKDDTLSLGVGAGSNMTIYTDPNNPKKIIFDTTGIENMIPALKHYFKTIGGVAATQVDDTLNIVGSNGITVSPAGKTITINGKGIADIISAIADSLSKFRDTSVDESRIEDLRKFCQPFVQQYNLSDWLLIVAKGDDMKYWGDVIITLAQSQYSPWIPYSDMSACIVLTDINSSVLSPDTISVAYAPQEGQIWIFRETWNGTRRVGVSLVKRYSIGDIVGALIDNQII